MSTSRTRIGGVAILAVAILAMSATTAAAQDLVEPVAGHAGEKAEDLQDDPVGFVEHHGSEEGLNEEAEWTEAYACFAGRAAAEQVDAPPPELPFCPDLEAADAGGAGEPQPVGEADPLEEDAVAVAERLVADALATVERIADEPSSVAAEALAFLERALAAVGRVAGAVLDAIGIGLRAGWDGLVAAALLPWKMQVFLYDAVVQGAGMVWQGVGWAAGVVGDGARVAGGAVSDLWHAASGTAAGALERVTKATSAAWQGLADAVDSLLGRDASPQARGRTAGGLPADVVGDREVRLDPIERLVPLA